MAENCDGEIPNPNWRLNEVYDGNRWDLSQFAHVLPADDVSSICSHGFRFNTMSDVVVWQPFQGFYALPFRPYLR